MNNHIENFKTKEQCRKEVENMKKDSDDITLSNAIFQGGLGFGKVCVPTSLVDFVIMILYPPAYIFFVEKDKGFTNIWQILVSFVLTSLFYFPGLIHALYTKYNYKCGGVLSAGEDV